MRLTLRLLFVLCTVLALVGSASSAHAAPSWTSASRATIHPGVVTTSPSGRCTANFVFYDSKYVYIGQAAHCTTKGTTTDVNGCVTASHPVGTRVRLQGGSRSGVMVYNSWETMKAAGERSTGVCRGNDFALVRIDAADRGRVNPTIPFWGGPRGVGKLPAPGDEVYSYGNSPLRQGLEPLSPKFGFATTSYNGGWSQGIYTLTPGIPGDSGSAVLDSRGRALGVVSTIAFVPPAENGVVNLAKALAYMKAKTSLDDVQLASGTVAFSGLP